MKESRDNMEEESKFHTVRGYQLMSQSSNPLTPAMEDYLEMIYRSSLTQGYMRIHTLSGLLNVAAPSATNMVQKLSRLGFLNYQKYGIIFLTDKGKEIGALLLHRHEIIENLLVQIGVENNALLETELIEHSISETTLYRMELFNRFLDANPEIVEKYKEFQRGNND